MCCEHLPSADNMCYMYNTEISVGVGGGDRVNKSVAIQTVPYYLSSRRDTVLPFFSQYTNMRSVPHNLRLDYSRSDHYIFLVLLFTIYFSGQ